jgi:hypothetical protein
VVDLRTIVVRALAATVYRRLLLFERELGDPSEPAAGVSVTAELLTEAAVDDYLALRPDARRADVLSRLKTGDSCFALRSRGRIVHVCWSTSRVAQIEYLGCRLPLPEDVVYVYDSFTDPSARHLHLSRVRAAWMERSLREHGHRRWWCAVLPENVVGRRFIESREGNRLVGTIGCWRVGTWRRAFTRPGWNDLQLPSRPSPSAVRPHSSEVRQSGRQLLR